MFNQIGLLSF